MRSAPALLVAAPASGQGKTTVTAGLARLHRNRGRRVRVFKSGPDFLDPMILAQAAGSSVYQLDLWMGGEDHCRQLLYDAAGEADLILVEGVMGLYDGTPSSADLAALFGLPVLAVVDASAMAQTFAAVVHGLAQYQAGLPFTGVLANCVGGAGHAALLAESVADRYAFLGALECDPAIALPSRHLGLLRAQEIADLDARIDAIARALEQTKAAALPQSVEFRPAPAVLSEPLLRGMRIAVASDAAFSFLYAANIDLLKAMGADIQCFSPLVDTGLPACDAAYLPGGYPELHLRELAANTAIKEAVKRHHAAGRPIVAECGGMLYLLESLSDTAGFTASMAGVLPGCAAMQEKLVNIGLHRAALPEGELRGHTFHHSRAEVPLAPIAHTEAARHHGKPEAIYRVGRTTAGYLHFYFPSNPYAAARLFLS